MIGRTTKIQIAVFVLISLLGVSYVSARYVGLTDKVTGNSFLVGADFAESGGIFSNAEVTYRGVTVGRVDRLELQRDGVRVYLRLDGGTKVPSDTKAVVANRSAVGEQYVDLQPATSNGPVLEAGSVIPMSRTSTPVPVEQLVTSLDDFVRSVPLDSLRTVVDQLGTAFAGTAQPLQKILDTTNAFTADAVDAQPQTLQLIRDGRTVLTTQNDVAGSFQSFSHDLALLANQLRTSDPDLRRLLQTGPDASAQVRGLLRESGTGTGDLVANLLTVSRVAEPRQDALRQLLVTYPGVIATSYTVLPADGTAHLGLVINLFDPFPCSQGYQGTAHRSGNDLTPVPPNADAHCAEPPGSPITVRGAQNVPRAATPTPPADAPVGPPSGGLPAGSAPVGSAPPLSSPVQILLG
jgi:phospholipid/cholesterol/gamma-HCH transport system substrate-binding protein